MDNVTTEHSYSTLQELHRSIQKTNQERRKLHSRKQLSDMLTKKFKTTMIGALASIEDRLGYLWAHGKTLSELNEEEIAFRAIWEEMRTDILNKGNSQLRAALEEISNYDLDWKKYRTEFIVRP